MTTNSNGQRLLALRELEGLTQGQLAERIGATQPLVSQVEKAERPLTPELLDRVRLEFSVPRSFFFVPPTVLDISFPTFRKSSNARAMDERRVVRRYREAARSFSAASEASGYHAFQIPKDLDQMDVETAAQEVRRIAGVERLAPIKNMTRLMERLGVGVVTQLDHGQDDAKHSGVSIPSVSSRRPLIALAAPMPGAVMRFTLAHELAHHIWDTQALAPWGSTRSPEERRAHDFAGALLLPANVVREHITPTLNLSGYLALKSRFGASVGAIIMRAQRLGILTKERTRSLQIQLSARGWRREEPVNVTQERPLLFAQAIGQIIDLTPRAVEEFTGLPSQLIFTWLGIEPSPPGHVVDMTAWRASKQASAQLRTHQSI